MKVVISRKGFDAAAGGCASPVFPDGSLLSLPIPSRKSTTTFGQLTLGKMNLGDLVSGLTRGTYGRSDGTHLDPDLCEEALPRATGWRPAFGQTGGPLTHLAGHNVGVGDLFLFFGWFKAVQRAEDSTWEYAPGGVDQHVIFGWLQIGEILDVGSMVDEAASERPWLAQHPHLQGEWTEKNAVFVATEKLNVPGLPELAALPGAGVFSSCADALRLTKPGQALRSLWSLPAAFAPMRGSVTVSYHGDDRWSADADDESRALLRSVGRGQEFVLEGSDPGPLQDWLRQLFRRELGVRKGASPNVLRPLDLGRRLFTYKVAHDAGNAPNPYHGVCTLAICKPAIRRVAKPSDVVVGFGCGSDERRIVYCMEVEHVISWQTYVDACRGKVRLNGIAESMLRNKIPAAMNATGDCIWTSGVAFEEALPSWSRHAGEGTFGVDVSSGRNVILSTRYWYFGRGDRFAIQLPPDLSLDRLIPGRGHQSDVNQRYRDDFVRFFNAELASRGVRGFGMHGVPALDSGQANRNEPKLHEDAASSWGGERAATISRRRSRC